MDIRQIQVLPFYWQLTLVLAKAYYHNFLASTLPTHFCVGSRVPR